MKNIPVFFLEPAVLTCSVNVDNGSSISRTMRLAKTEGQKVAE